jgi:outer membrane protein TolC
MLPALDFGITYYSYRISQDRAHQQRLLVDRAEQLLRRDVRIAYARYAGTMRQEKLAAIAYQAAQQVLRVALSLERAQVTVPADTALVEAALAEANVELNRTRQKMHENRLKLAQFMSLPPGVEFTVIAEAPNLPLPPDAAQVASLADRALAVRPELAVQDLERHVSANGVRRAFAEFFPRIDLVGSFSWADTPGAVNPAFFTGGYQVAHSLLDGGATLVRYSMAKDTAQTENVRTLLLSLGVLYDVQLRALTVREDYEAIQAATKLEAARRAALKQILSMYLEGLEDEAGAARSLADLTIQSTVLDKAITDYQVAWYELEAAALPAVSPSATAATQPTSQPSAGSLLDSILPPGISVPGIFGNSTDGGAAAPATSATQPVKP